MLWSRQLLALLMLAYVLLYLLPLASRPLTVPSEARYAEIPREMRVSGDWVVPHLNGLRYFEKPPLGYWAAALAMTVFGENVFASRLPAALSSLLSALLIGLLVRRFGGGLRPAWLAGAIYLGCLQIFVTGVTNLLDSFLALWLNAALVAFFYAMHSDTVKTRWLFLTGFGVACGFAFLTKGFLAFAVPVLVIVPFMLWAGRWRELLRCCWWPIACAVLVALPWSLSVHGREADFWHYFFWIEHIKRFTAGAEAQHSQPVWYFLPVLLAGALPWILLLPAAFAGLRGVFTALPLQRYALLWLVLPFLFFSASNGKLATYILPCFPGLAILLALGLERYLVRSERSRLFFWGAWSSAGLAGLVALGLGLSQVLPMLPKLYAPGEAWRWLALVLALSGWVWLAVLAARLRDPEQRLLAFAAAPLLLMLCLPWVFPQQVLDRKAPGKFLHTHADLVTPETRLVADAGLMHAVNWYYQREDVYLLHSQGEVAYGLSYPDARSRYLNLNEVAAFVATGAPVLVVHENSPEFAKLPLPDALYRQGRFVIRYYQP